MGYDLPLPERKHFASSCFCVDNGVGAGTGAGTGAGGEVLGAWVHWIFLGCSIGGVLLRGTVGSSFGVDALSVFFFFLETTSFHSPRGEWSVVVSKLVTVVGVLGLTSGGALLSSIVGDRVRHTASLNEAANLGGVGAAILDSAILPRSSSLVAELFLLVVFLFGVLRGNCQVIFNLTICFPSVNPQIGLPTIGNLLIASAQTSGTSIVSISQVMLRLGIFSLSFIQFVYMSSILILCLWAVLLLMSSIFTPHLWVVLLMCNPFMSSTFNVHTIMSSILMHSTFMSSTFNLQYIYEQYFKCATHLWAVLLMCHNIQQHLKCAIH